MSRPLVGLELVIDQGLCDGDGGGHLGDYTSPRYLRPPVRDPGDGQLANVPTRRLEERLVQGSGASPQCSAESLSVALADDHPERTAAVEVKELPYVDIGQVYEFGAVAEG